jgi:hypothetical protein
VERKGFCENHLKGTVTTHLFSSASLTLTPAKKALGNLDNKKILNLTGCFMSCINSDVPEFIALIDYRLSKATMAATALLSLTSALK